MTQINAPNRGQVLWIGNWLIKFHKAEEEFFFFLNWPLKQIF